MVDDGVGTALAEGRGQRLLDEPVLVPGDKPEEQLVVDRDRTRIEAGTVQFADKKFPVGRAVLEEKQAQGFAHGLGLQPVISALC